MILHCDVDPELSAAERLFGLLLGFLVLVGAAMLADAVLSEPEPCLLPIEEPLHDHGGDR